MKLGMASLIEESLDLEVKVSFGFLRDLDALPKKLHEITELEDAIWQGNTRNTQG